MVLCNTCHTALHLRCRTDAIADKKDVQECIDYIKNLINKIVVNSEVFKAHKYIKDFDLEIKRYRDSLQLFEQKVEFTSIYITIFSLWQLSKRMSSKNSKQSKRMQFSNIVYLDFLQCFNKLSNIQYFLWIMLW